MKYLKLYEAWESFYTKYSLNNYLKIHHPHDDLSSITVFDCVAFTNADYRLTSLDGIEKLPNLISFNCNHNNLTSLKGVENLKKLNILSCTNNKLRNLDEVINLKKLMALHALHNDWEYPLQQRLIDRFGFNDIYTYGNIKKFKTYEFQKKCLTEHPERYKELEECAGILPEIKEEFPALVRGTEWGFFDLEK